MDVNTLIRQLNRAIYRSVTNLHFSFTNLNKIKSKINKVELIQKQGDMKMNHFSKMIGTSTLFAILFMSSLANAQWTSYTYTNSDGKAAYGVKNGRTEKIALNTTEKKANRTAKKLNRQESKVMADPNGDGDHKEGGDIPGFPK